MAAASASSPPTLAPSSASPCEESQKEDREAPTQDVQKETKEEVMYKTKTIPFLGRTTPIILQNENGPCPLLAICNVLLLRNNLNLNPDSSEVSQERLLSLVAERLIDSNSNVDNKDKEYVENQQQNIADAIDLLPRLATGIDVNIRFRRIDDFEFTPECAIFDLLDIPLYHGWIVDPQDVETANAIGSKSYNTLMGELVALETQNVEVCRDQNPGEDSVDFVAATTAALGVPSPCLSKTRSFDDSPPAAAELRKLRKGDLEEEAELLKALELSESEVPTSMHETPVDIANGGSAFVYSDENQSSDEDALVNSQDNVNARTGSHCGNISEPEESKSDENKTLSMDENMINAGKEVCSTSSTTKSGGAVHCDQLSSKESGERTACDGGIEKGSKQTYADDAASSEMHSAEKINLETTKIDSSSGILLTDGNATSVVPVRHPPSLDGINLMDVNREGEIVNKQSTPIISILELAKSVPGDVRPEVSGLSLVSAPHDSCGRSQHHDVPDALTLSMESDEPMYEGEECVNPGSAVCEDKEPVYEGEAVLAKTAEKNAADDSSQGRATEGLTPEEGYLIRNFLKYSASQLTFCGLFRLQEGLKERELCVFFRNNHFSTMFKYEGELYLLATDQGYLNQSDLVWEKLNEVNGDTLFMTGNFKVFKMESGNTSGTWDEQNVVTSTADYLASINSSSETGTEINPDLQLAIALQQQEFEQQSPRNSTPSQPPANASRLVTGPQVPRSSYKPSSASASSKPEGKSSKEKCTVM